MCFLEDIYLPNAWRYQKNTSCYFEMAALRNKDRVPVASKEITVKTTRKAHFLIDALYNKRQSEHDQYKNEIDAYPVTNIPSTNTQIGRSQNRMQTNQVLNKCVGFCLKPTYMYDMYSNAMFR